MKFSEKWLREFVNPKLGTQELVHQITMAGLEVDAVEPVAGAFDGVVVGEVISRDVHPNADKLSLCQVTDGSETFQVVCGAPNVREGLKVPFAKIGAVLPGDFRIKKAKLRGVESFGMLCAEAELGLSDASDGLMELPQDAPVGQDFRAYLGLDDVMIDVDLTPNRSDCLSVIGLAREVAVLNNMVLEEIRIKPVEEKIEDTFPVDISAPQACPKYIGRVIRGVDVQAETPVWMREKLRRSGLRSIHPVVDVTNYVMIELGQPMHAFDLNVLEGGIVVRMAQEGEKLVLLDGQEVELREDTLVIADQKKVLAIAGVMGGEHSGITDNTQDIFLESAFFSPLAIAGKARSYGLHTDSSHRFERGVDFTLQTRAIERATQLLLDIVGGTPGPVIKVKHKEHLPKRDLVELRYEKVRERLGVHIDKTRIEEILTKLGMPAERLTKDGIRVHVPGYRFDISIEADLIEEVGRIYGYDNLPVTEPVGSLALKEQPEASVPADRVVDHLISRGYQEVVTYSFVDSRMQDVVNPGVDAIPLANPISSDMDVMRTSLWPGLLKVVAYNQKRQKSRLKLIETGLTFLHVDEVLVQKPYLGGVLAGRRYPENWTSDKAGFDFYDAKADLESLFQLLGCPVEFVKTTHKALHPGQSAELRVKGRRVGYVGALHPALYKKLDLIGPVLVFELSLEVLKEGAVPVFHEFSKFPEVRRDLAIIVDATTPFAEVRKVIRQSAGDWLQDVVVFDCYQGDGIAPGKKSLALGVTWQHPDRTLNDEEVAGLFNGVIERLVSELGAVLRG